jgi:hypothetical protein
MNRDVDFLLKKYEKPTKAERYSNEYQNKINQETARKNRHLILDELMIEVPFTVKKSHEETIRMWIDDFSIEFKDFHRQASDEAIILVFIFLMRKEDYPYLDVSHYSISKKYGITPKVFELIVCRLVLKLLKTMPIIYRQSTRKDHEILQKTGKH